MSESSPLMSSTLEAPKPESLAPEPINFHHVDEFGKPIKLDPKTTAESEQAVLNFQESFAASLQELPNHTENLNLERINGFLQGHGIEPTPFHVIEEDELPVLGDLYKQTLTDSGLGGLYDPSDFDPKKNTKKGWHDALTGQTFVVRNHMREIENGPEFTESIIVHEQFHAASEHDDMVIAHDENGQVIHAAKTRVGLMLPDKNLTFGKGRKAPNYFLEEAAASYFEGQYKKEFKPSVLKRLLDKEDRFGMPYEYANFNGGEVVDQNGYGTAGYALDLMIEAKPELLDAVVESRKSAQGLRDVARIINDIKPGLYSALSRIDPTLFHEENLIVVMAAIKDIDEVGHQMLGTSDNPEGRVKPGFVSNRDRVTYRAARSLDKSLGSVIKKAIKLNKA